MARPDEQGPAHRARPNDKKGLFGLSAVCAVLFVVSYFAFGVNGGADGEKVDTVFGLGASNVALGASLGGLALAAGLGLASPPGVGALLSVLAPAARP